MNSAGHISQCVYRQVSNCDLVLAVPPFVCPHELIAIVIPGA